MLKWAIATSGFALLGFAGWAGYYMATDDPADALACVLMAVASWLILECSYKALIDS